MLLVSGWQGSLQQLRRQTASAGSHPAGSWQVGGRQAVPPVQVQQGRIAAVAHQRRWVDRPQRAAAEGDQCSLRHIAAEARCCNVPARLQAAG